jgi:polysaccharide chain length determinant protein (PEP-CTERM system associated)
MDSLYEEIRITAHGVWQRRWLALGVAWAVCLIGWLIISTIPNTYESKASVFVQTQSLLPDKLGITPAERKSDIDGITQTLTSAENLENVVRGTDLIQQGATPGDVASQAAGLRKNIEIVAKQDNLFEISASAGYGGLSNAKNSKLAKDIVQKLLDLFVEGSLAGNRTETTQTLRFLDSQLSQREQQLLQAEAKRAAFEAKYMGLLPGIGSVSQRMETARAELGQVDSNLMAAQGALAAVNGQMNSIPQSVSTPGGGFGGGPALGRAAAIEGQIAEGQARGWTESHPDMASLRSQLGRARAAAVAEARGGRVVSSGTPNPMYVTLRSMQAEKQAAVGALGARKAQLQAEMAQFQTRQIEEPGVAAEQQRLNRDYEVLKAQYDKLLANREEVKLRGSLQTDTNSISFRVIEPPVAPRAPAAPNRPLLLVLVLFVGLGAGAGAAFAMGQLKTSYATAGRLEKASGLPVIGSISEVLTPVQRVTRRQQLKYFVGGSAALVGAFVLLLIVEFVQRGMVA